MDKGVQTFTRQTKFFRHGKLTFANGDSLDTLGRNERGHLVGVSRLRASMDFDAREALRWADDGGRL